MTYLLEDITRRELFRNGFFIALGLSLPNLFSCNLENTKTEDSKKTTTKPISIEEKKATLKFIDNYSKWNEKRAIRPQTDYIVLHTTEGGGLGSLNKLTRNGEANYIVDTDGTIYRIIDKDKIAKHAGRSLWNGRYNISTYSIGIEVVGYANQDITSTQYKSLKSLISELQEIYHINDEDVLTHSMVAYGTPNKWHSESYRGRKRCGMLFATPEVRKKLGLTSKPINDQDVSAGRVIVADGYLNNILYGSGSLPETNNHKSKISPTARVEIGDSQTENEFEGFRVIGVDGVTPWEIAGKEYASSNTIYFLKGGKVRRGNQLSKYNLDHLPNGTNILVGYVYGGHVHRNRSAIKICGREWNYPSTYYRFPDGVIKSGDEINQQKIPKGTLVLYRK